MKSILAATTIAAALMASPAAAQPFTYSVEFSQPDLIGGMGEDGRNGRSATMSGPFTSTGPDGGSVSGNVECIAMDPNRERRLGPLLVLDGPWIIPTAPTHRTFQAQRTRSTQTSIFLGCRGPSL